MVPMAIRAALKNPFPGLRPFDEADAGVEFRHEPQLAALMGRLSRARFVSVIGASGCGKSSLVRAGLIPILREQYEGSRRRWAIAKTHPGTRPVYELATALHSLDLVPGGAPEEVERILRRDTLGIVEFLRASGFEPRRRLLVFVDQFEELFRYRRFGPGDSAPDESAFYVKLLLESAHEPNSPVYIVTTMRSEYIEDCSEFYDLSEAMNDGLFLLARMTREQSEKAIEYPLESQNAEIEPALIRELIDETDERTDGLPLLQHGLSVIWGNWNAAADAARRIGLQDFETSEGNPDVPMVNRLLDVHLDRIYAELIGDVTTVATCFKLLSEWDAKGRETRRTCSVQEMMDVSGSSLATIRRVVHAFRDEKKGRTFLRVLDEGRGSDSIAIAPGDIVDLSHECLMRQWARLRDWMAQEYRDSAMLRDLARECDAGAVLSDIATRRYCEWRDRFRPSPPWAGRYSESFHPVLGRQEISLDRTLAFLKENELRQAENARNKAENERQRAREERQRAVRRWQMIVAVFVILALMATAFASIRLANESQKAANESRKAAAAAKKLADLQQKQTASAIHAREQSDQLAQSKSREADLEREKSRLAEAARKKDEGIATRAIQEQKKDAALVDDARQARKAAEDAKSKSDIDAEKAKQQTVLADQRSAEAKRAEAATRTLANQNLSKTLVQSAWRRADSGESKRNEALAYLAKALELDHSSVSARTWIFDLLLRKKGSNLARPYFHGPIQPGPAEDPMKRLLSAMFGPAGSVVTASWNNRAQIWNASGAASGAPLIAGCVSSSLPNCGTVNYAEFSSDGKYVATAHADYQAIVWDARTGTPLGNPYKHAAPVLSASFSSDGARMVTASWDKTAMIWKVGAPGDSIKLRHSTPVNFAAFDSTGNFVVTAGWDGCARIWDAHRSSETPRALVCQAAKLWSARFNNDGTQIVTASADNTAVVWDWQSGIQVGETLRHGKAVNSAAFSPDGHWVVTASDDGTARVWDAQTGLALGEPLVHNARVSSAVFSADGKRVLTASFDGTARTRDVRFDFRPDPNDLDADATLFAKLAGEESGLQYEALPDGALQPNKESPAKLRQDLLELAAKTSSTPGSAAWFVRWYLSN